MYCCVGFLIVESEEVVQDLGFDLMAVFKMGFIEAKQLVQVGVD